VRKRTIAALTSLLVLAYCQPAPATGIQISKEVRDEFFQLPEGVIQQQVSLGDNHVFSKMVSYPLGYAGMTFIWINGIPWLIPVYFPHTETVNSVYPWLQYPPPL